MITGRQAARLFYKVGTYLGLLVPEIYAITNSVKIVREILEIYSSCVHGHTDRQPDFLQGLTYLDRLPFPKIYVIPNFVKIVRAVLEIYSSCVHRHTDRQPDFLQG